MKSKKINTTGYEINLSNQKELIRAVNAHVGRKIRELREQFRLSSIALAPILGITFQQLIKYEKGYSKISASKLYALSEFFGVNFNYFINGFEYKSERKRHSPNETYDFSGQCGNKENRPLPKEESSPQPGEKSCALY